ncbi:MAG: alpha/beta hydrolase [Parasphingorhabdus sp.]|uniref:alpha/beta hydrolase n=1 Tax=Parasphingorhabdus sp. TaxID=2709688 RepID=UPI0032980F85
MRAVIMSLVIAAGLYLIIVAMAYTFQRALLYAPDRNGPSEQDLTAADFSSVSINADEHVLQSLWRKPVEEAKPVFLHLHGNAGSTAVRLPIYQAMAADGAGVLAVGYPGYGGNPGSPDEQALYKTARANYDWLIAQGFKAEQIIIVGQSLGTGVATWLATEKDAAGLILEAAYTAMDDMAQRQFPILPAKWLTKDRYPSFSRIDQINMPLIWIHGTNDGLIPFAMGQKLFDAAREPKTARAIKNGGHNDLWMRGIDAIIRNEADRLVPSDPS